mgnify:CR=1 FL=1
MQTFDVKHIPNGYLRGQWACQSFVETRGLAHAFSHLARPFFAAATPQEKFRLGFTADKVKRGKSTFIESLLRDIYPTEQTEADIDEGFSLDIGDDQHLLYYDQRRAKTLHRLSRLPIANHYIGKQMRAQFMQLKALTSIHIAEWPEYGWDRNYNALWRLQGRGDYVQWSLFAAPELAEHKAFDSFSQKAKPLELTR